MQSSSRRETWRGRKREREKNSSWFVFPDRLLSSGLNSKLKAISQWDQRSLDVDAVSSEQEPEWLAVSSGHWLLALRQVAFKTEMCMCTGAKRKQIRTLTHSGLGSSCNEHTAYTYKVTAPWAWRQVLNGPPGFPGFTLIGRHSWGVWLADRRAKIWSSGQLSSSASVLGSTGGLQALVV